MTHNITVEGGTSARLPTAGKYCDRDIVVTATGGGSVNKPATISGINLHNAETDIPNTYLDKATVIAYNNWKTTDFIKVENGKFYFIYSTSAIGAQYCSKFDANKDYVRTLSGPINCTSKNQPLFISGHDGYFRFSGNNTQINSLEFYEVINFNWEVSE